MNKQIGSSPFTLHLTGIAHGGESLGRHQGKVVFVPYTIPGETVRVQVVEEKARWARAELLEVLEPSADRVDAPCPYFGPGKCGGCQWQHIAYPRQLELKRDIVTDQLTRLGHVDAPPVLATLDTGAAWEYRNHAQFRPDADGRLGFRRAGSHDVIAVDRCLILHPLLQELHEELDLELPGLTRLTLRAGVATAEQMVVLETEHDEAPELEVDVPLSVVLLRRRDRPFILAGRGYLEEVVAGNTYRVSAESFFQVNTAGAQRLARIVERYLDVGPEDRLLDAYCGVGLFALALAPLVAEAVGIETAPSASLDFIENAQAQGLQNVSFIQGPVEEVLADWVEEADGKPAPRTVESPAEEDEVTVVGQPIDVMVVDPPRSGVGEAALRALADLGPRRFVYVSCDPATLARDVQAVVRAGYRLVEVQPLDMFPQTYHVESVALFELGT